MKKNNIISCLVLLSAFFVSCAKTDFDPIDPSKLIGDSLNTNYTIKQLIDSFVKDTDEYTYVKYGAQNSGLFSSNLINSPTDIIINGVVTSSDADGNIYKYITVQDFSSGRAIKVSIDASGLSAVYPLGKRVWIRCNGLYIGNYAQSPQIGTLYSNTDKSVIKQVISKDTVKVNNKDTVKLDTTYVTVYRTEPGRIPLPIAMKAIYRYGLPDTTLVKADTMTIAEIKAAGASAFNRLVCVKNAFFTGNGADYNLPVALSASELIFAPSTNGVGYPQSREIQDGTGSMFVSTSEYARFATTKLPDSSNRGNITAIVGWYNDKTPAVNPNQSLTKIYHQITIRSLSDLGKGFEKFHAEVGK